MDTNLEKYYLARIEMFASRGWRELMEDVEKMLDAIENVSAIKDLDDLRFKQGEMSIIRWLVGLEKMSRDTFEELKNETD